MYQKTLIQNEKIFAVAPMMDWTDRHCRYFHRLLTGEALLYTEMVTADAVIHGNRDRLLGFHDTEHPLAVQLGGSVPEKLSTAAKICADHGYDEINLNVGCPSDRVKSGFFGACLMEKPELVADCVAAMKDAVDVPITVKCRIGVDEQDVEVALDTLTNAVLKSGVDALWVHARKAWLQGLSPKQNRDIPPLDYDRVYRLKQRLPDTFIGINGGIKNLGECAQHLTQVDGVMLGRAAYHDASLLNDVDHAIYGAASSVVDWDAIAQSMMVYAEDWVQQGGKLSNITRHMIGLFAGLKGSKRYRQILSEEARGENAKPEVITRAFAAVDKTATKAAA